MGDYTLKHYNLDEVGLLQPLKNDLGLTAVGVSLSRVEPGMGYPFYHAHKEQEEIFICLKGSGTILVDNKEITMRPGDILRIAPDVPRAVGNRTKEPCTFLLLGALPNTRYKNDESLMLIDDGIEMADKNPDWSIR
ncbi:cupin domain-containing protein [Candidatus Poribacteria bacterium]|nr:cupin domain-containing protein [Candidatus Poribacteria bacterium]